jgi:hypothetical protein
MKVLVVLLTVVGVFTSTDSFSVCDDVHENACPANCQCDCSSQTAIHTHVAFAVELPLREQHETPATPRRVDRLVMADIFRPPISA